MQQFFVVKAAVEIFEKSAGGSSVSRFSADFQIV